MEAKRLGELRKIAAEAGKGNAQIFAQDLCELVVASGTDNAGLKKAAEALQDQPREPVIVQAADLTALLNAVPSSPPESHRGSSGGSPVAKPTATEPPTAK